MAIIYIDKFETALTGSIGTSDTLLPVDSAQAAKILAAFEFNARLGDSEREVVGAAWLRLPLGWRASTFMRILGLGMWPDKTRDDLPRMPKGRYKIMLDHMPRVGTMGLDMMLRTCTIQTNLDYASEAALVKKFRVSPALQPLATALFAISPFTEGKPNGFLSYRSHIWTDTDAARTGMLPFVFEDGFGFERWADYILDVPMYFAVRDGKYVDLAGQDFRAFMDGKLDALPGERATLGDWNDHISTAFPEVRLKSYLEMRGAYGGPWNRICALPAFWVGLIFQIPVIGSSATHWLSQFYYRFVVGIVFHWAITRYHDFTKLRHISLKFYSYIVLIFCLNLLCLHSDERVNQCWIR